MSNRTPIEPREMSNERADVIWRRWEMYPTRNGWWEVRELLADHEAKARRIAELTDERNRAWAVIDDSIDYKEAWEKAESRIEELETALQNLVDTLPDLMLQMARDSESWSKIATDTVRRYRDEALAALRPEAQP